MGMFHDLCLMGVFIYVGVLMIKTNLCPFHNLSLFFNLNIGVRGKE